VSKCWVKDVSVLKRSNADSSLVVQFESFEE